MNDYTPRGTNHREVADHLARAGMTEGTSEGYAIERVYGECAERGVSPVVPLRETPAVKRGAHNAPCCENGEWRFAGATRSRLQAAGNQVALPDGRVQARFGLDRGRQAASADSARDAALARSLQAPRRGREREFGRLKNEWALAPHSACVGSSASGGML
jgi:hypothetical protein